MSEGVASAEQPLQVGAATVVLCALPSLPPPLHCRRWRRLLVLCRRCVEHSNNRRNLLGETLEHLPSDVPHRALGCCSPAAALASLWVSLCRQLAATTAPRAC